MAVGPAIYRHEGFAIDWINDTGDDVAAGTVIDLGTFVGIPSRDIADGDTGALQIQGVYEVDKDAVAVTLGQTVSYNSGTSKAHPGTGYAAVMGVAVKAADAGDATVWVFIHPAFGGGA